MGKHVSVTSPSPSTILRLQKIETQGSPINFKKTLCVLFCVHEVQRNTWNIAILELMPHKSPGLCLLLSWSFCWVGLLICSHLITLEPPPTPFFSRFRRRSVFLRSSLWIPLGGRFGWTQLSSSNISPFFYILVVFICPLKTWKNNSIRDSCSTADSSVYTQAQKL